MSFYLDASAILPILIEEPSSDAVEDFLSAADETLIVGEFTAAEVVSGLSRRARTGSLDIAATNAGLAQFDAWRAAFTLDIDLRAADVRLAHVFVRRFDLGLRAPDAMHAAVCRRGGHVLVTLDRRLAIAAEALGVRVIRPGEFATGG